MNLLNNDIIQFVIDFINKHWDDIDKKEFLLVETKSELIDKIKTDPTILAWVIIELMTLGIEEDYLKDYVIQEAQDWEGLVIEIKKNVFYQLDNDPDLGLVFKRVKPKYTIQFEPIKYYDRNFESDDHDSITQLIEIAKSNGLELNDQSYDKYLYLSILKKWLLDKYHIDFSIWYNNLTNKWRIFFIKNIKTNEDLDTLFPEDDNEYELYDDVLEVVIYKTFNVLNLIINKNE